MLVNRHVDDLSLTMSFNFFVLAYRHRNQLARSLLIILGSGHHLQLNQIVAVQGTKWFELKAFKGSICIVEKATEIYLSHAKLILTLKNFERSALHVVVSLNIDVYIAVNGGDCHIVDEGYTFRPTQGIIFIDLECKNIKLILVYSHKLVVDPHGLLLEYLELAVTQLVLLKLVEVIELYELSYPDHVRVKLNVEEGAD
jgi:hypothetical protein